MFLPFFRSLIHLRELRFSPHLGNIERCTTNVAEVKIKPSLCTPWKLRGEWRYRSTYS